jgi:hypothetical protein
MTSKHEDELAERIRDLVTPSRTDVLRAKRAVLSKFDDGRGHTAATLLDAASDAFEAMRDMNGVKSTSSSPHGRTSLTNQRQRSSF